MDRETLLHTLRHEGAGWQRAIDAIPDERMEQPAIVGHWPAKTVVAHVMSFERWTAAQIRASLRGRPATAAERYETDDIPDDIEGSGQEEFNATIELLYGDWSVTRVRESARRAFADLVTAVESLTDADLSNPGRFDWCHGMTLSDIIPRQTWQHYALHLPALRTLAGGQEE